MCDVCVVRDVDVWCECVCDVCVDVGEDGVRRRGRRGDAGTGTRRKERMKGVRKCFGVGYV